MTILQMGTLAVAALVALWPAVSWIPKIIPIAPTPAPDGISYQTAMEAFAAASAAKQQRGHRCNDKGRC